MMCIAVISVFITHVSTVTTHDYGGYASCGMGEAAAGRQPLMDAFCNPELTHPSKLNELRHCVCDAGYVRNAWGHCITVEECEMCKALPNHDFHNCESACPLTCGEPVPAKCTLQCVARCACPPGYVRVRHQENTCVPVSQCSPICPVNSTFELCMHGCAPQCRQDAHAAGCTPSCHWGELLGFPNALHIVQSIEQLSYHHFQSKKLRNMLDAIPTTHLPADFIAQIQLFKSSLDSNQLCANAFGFFTLDKSLLVSTAASVLSFTILLVQTGQEFKAG